MFSDSRAIASSGLPTRSIIPPPFSLGGEMADNSKIAVTNNEEGLFSSN
jgi:hypothetical protein